MVQRLRIIVSGILSFIVLGLVYHPAANADFHINQLSEVMAGLNGDPTVQFVEIRMLGSGENCQGSGHHPLFGEPADNVSPPCAITGTGASLVFFNAAGTQTAQFIFPNNTSLGQGGRNILIATQQFVNLGTMPQPDFIMPPSVVANSGKVCYRNRPSAPFGVDSCVEYGSFKAPQFGPPAPALPVTGNQSLKRVGANFSNSDFVLATPGPCNNARINCPDEAPFANAQSVTTVESTPVNIFLRGSDPENAPLTFSIVTNPTNGVLSGTPPSITYTPNANFIGADSFTFTVNDGIQDSSPATVSIAVNPNQPPVASPQGVTAIETRPVGIFLSGFDPEFRSLSFSIVTNPTNGLLSGTPPFVTYTANLGFIGSDSFTFKVNDGFQDSSPATVSISVIANRPPVANPQNLTTAFGTSLSIFLTGFDPDFDPLTFNIATNPMNGVLTGTPPNVTYTPNPGFSGSDSFTFRANDGRQNSSPATVSIMVRPPCSTTPIAKGETKTGTLSNTDCFAPHRSFSSADLYTFSGTAGEQIKITMGPSGLFFLTTLFLQDPVGTVIASSSSSCFGGQSCIPFNALSGGFFTLPVSGTYTIEATSLFSFVTGSYTVTLTSNNNPPTANPQNVFVTEDTPADITLSGTDPEAAPLTYNIVTGPTKGQLSGTPPFVTYTPSPDFTGPDTFTFKANDGVQDSAIATVSITILAANDSPVADAGPDQAVPEGALVTLDGSGSSDTEDSSLNFSWQQIAGPPVVLSGRNTAMPTFLAPFFGPAGGLLTFRLTVTDSASAASTDDVDIQVVAGNILLDHFRCYTAVKPKAPPGQPLPTFTPLQVTLADQFETKLTDVVKPLAVCAPADKNGEGVLDPNTHLEAYQIVSSATPPQPKFVPQRNTVSNQLGALVVNSTKVDRLLVPTSKALGDVPPPLPPNPVDVDHYKCYAITVAKAPKGQPPYPRFTPVNVTVDDQFGTRILTLSKPVRLCNPVDKNGEGIKHPDSHLVCYQGAIAKTTPPQPPFAKTRVALTNQFGSEVLDLTVGKDFCVPSAKGPPP